LHKGGCQVRVPERASDLRVWHFWRRECANQPPNVVGAELGGSLKTCIWRSPRAKPLYVVHRTGSFMHSLAYPRTPHCRVVHTENGSHSQDIPLDISKLTNLVRFTLVQNQYLRMILIIRNPKVGPQFPPPATERSGPKHTLAVHTTILDQTTKSELLLTRSVM
jgi:hypothetical protein